MQKITYIIITILLGTFAILAMSFLLIMDGTGMLPGIVESIEGNTGELPIDQITPYVALSVVILIIGSKLYRSKRCKYCGRLSMNDKCSICLNSGVAEPLKIEHKKMEIWGIVFLAQIVVYASFIYIVATKCSGFGCFFASIWGVIILMLGFLFAGIISSIKESAGEKAEESNSPGNLSDAWMYSEKEIEEMKAKLKKRTPMSHGGRKRH